VVWADIYKTTKRILTQKKFWRALTSSDWDLLYAYIIWQIERLSVGGRLVVLCPITWFANHGGGAGLRLYLAQNTQLEILVSLGLQNILGEAAASWAVLVFCRQAPDAKRRTRIVEITQKNCDLELVLPSIAADLEKIPAERSYERSRSAYRFYNRRNFLADDSWYLATPAEEAAIHALEDSAPLQLGEVVDLSLGPISGANEAFALSEEEAAAIPTAEQKLVRYFVRAEHCKRWRVTGTAAYLWPNEINDLGELKTTYPTIFRRLTSFMQALSARYLPANRPWWHWTTIRGVGTSEVSGGHLFVPGSTSNAPARYSYAKDSALFGLGDLLTISTGKQNK
jgi:adenine-specific DNA-methyltransferase